MNFRGRIILKWVKKYFLDLNILFADPNLFYFYADQIILKITKKSKNV
jgi:hypothetical protein